MPTDSLTPFSLSRREFLKRSAVVSATAAAGSSLLTGCGSGSGSGGAVTFLSMLPLETLAMSPVLNAVAGGHFAKHGLEVTPQPVKGTAQAMQTLIAGVAPVSRFGQIDVMTEVADSKQPLVNIGTLCRGSTVKVVYSKQNPLEKPEDFVGKTIGVPSENGTSSKVVSLILANAGLDPSKVRRQVTGLTPGTFTLVQQGRIAGYVVSIDTANILLSQHDDVGVFDPSTVVKSDSQVYVVTEEVLEKDPDMVKAFMAGITDSLRSIVADENFDKTIATLREKYSFATLDDDQIARRSLSMMREGWTGGDPSRPLLVTDEAEWLRGYEELVAAGQAKPGGNAKSWFDNSILPKPQG